MSVYQWVEFRAVDAPLDDEALAYMSEQSSRAEIDGWRFTNEYHYGDFRGDHMEMLRRGYDVHVHYTNFGLRRVAFRIPDECLVVGQLEPYLLQGEIIWEPDEKGNGGIIRIEPEGDAGTWDWTDNVKSLASDLTPLRDMIMAGDFRPLYIAHIGFNYCDDAKEPPVPAGLGEEHSALERLCSLYEIDPDLIAVAAERSSEMVKAIGYDAIVQSWLDRQSLADVRSHLGSCLRDPRNHARRLLRKICNEASGMQASPQGSRTIGELREAAARISDERERQLEIAQAKEAARIQAAARKARREKILSIAQAPAKTLAAIDAAIEERNRPAYQRAAHDLALLAEACGRSVAVAKVEELRSIYSNRSALFSELKKVGF